MLLLYRTPFVFLSLGLPVSTDFCAGVSERSQHLQSKHLTEQLNVKAGVDPQLTSSICDQGVALLQMPDTG